MRQFDIFANPFPRSRERQPFLVTLQSDLLVQNLDTVVVAPLEPATSGTFAERLNPRVEIDGDAFVLIAQELATIRKSALGPARGSAESQRDSVIAALDLLFTGNLMLTFKLSHHARDAARPAARRLDLAFQEAARRRPAVARP